MLTFLVSAGKRDYPIRTLDHEDETQVTDADRGAFQLWMTTRAAPELFGFFTITEEARVFCRSARSRFLSSAVLFPEREKTREETLLGTEHFERESVCDLVGSRPASRGRAAEPQTTTTSASASARPASRASSSEPTSRRRRRGRHRRRRGPRVATS